MAALLIKGEVMAQDHIDKFTHQADDVVVILPDGTLLDTDPVQRLLDRTGVTYLQHQIVIPFSLYLDLGCRTEE